MEHSSDYTHIEQRVRRTYRRRTWLINHLLIFIALNAALWLNYLSFALRAEVFHVNALMDRLLVTLVWFILLVVHYVNARQAAAMEREIDQLLRQEADADAKPKRVEPEVLSRLSALEDDADTYLSLDDLLLGQATAADDAPRHE